MMADWHCCTPGHAWGDDGICLRCGAYEPEKRIKKVEYASGRDLAAFALRMVVERIGFRIDVMRERGLDGVSISKGFAQQIVRACQHGSELLENPKPAQAGLTVGGGSGSANVSEGVTAEREPAGEVGGEAEGHLKLPGADDPPADPLLNHIDWNAESRRLSSGLLAIHAAGEAATVSAIKSVAYDIALNCIDADTATFQIKRRSAEDFDYRCDCCDNGLYAEWDFCPFCGLCQREQPSGLCLAGLASNKACRPDDTLNRCTICGFVVDTQYAAEKPATHLR